MPTWSVTSAPAAEPLTLTEAKLYLKVTSTSENDLITALITDARQYVERLTLRALITQTITEYWDTFPVVSTVDRAARFLFPSVGPVQSVTSIAYIPEAGTPAAYTTWGSGNYTLDAVSGIAGISPARIYKNPNIDWPDIEDYYNAVKVVYVAGYGAAGSSVPGPLKEAMRRLIGRWYYGRSDSQNDYDIISALISPYKLQSK